MKWFILFQTLTVLAIARFLVGPWVIILREVTRTFATMGG